MGFINSGTLLSYARLYRVVYIGGRYGGGKTTLAYRLAYELLQTKEYHYLISNVKSVWNDNPVDVVLRDGQFADCIIILDEGGLFLETSREAKEFLAFLRKMNICIIIPSVQPPAARLRQLTIQRIMNLQIFGVPAWYYRIDLFAGAIRENDWFLWWKPAEIYGVYDTLGVPSDDGQINEYLKIWAASLAKEGGYKAPNTNQVKTLRAFSDFATGETARQNPPTVAIDDVAELRGAIIDIQQAQENLSDIIQISSIRGRQTRRG